ncbi:MAG TPA: amylo-alpha-1,6-glucosidase [Burkholderiales bacterium]|nr:amylo-alpha-1,6-glucosidase [Burkholderiales bacterium]
MVKLPNFIRFGRDICGDLDQAERREWWLANGLGAYAAGTIAGTLTRRYHGLLIAPVNPPLGRHLVFAKAEAAFFDGSREWPLASNRWKSGAIAPAGHLHIESFHLEGRMPVWRYALGDIALEMRIWMEPGAHTTYIAYRVHGMAARAGNCGLSVRLLTNARDHHGSARPWEFNPVIESDTHTLRVLHPNWFALHFRARGGTLSSRHDWIERFDLSAERERGLPDEDNHLCVGEATFKLTPGEWVGLTASLDDNASPYLEEAMRRFQAHDSALLKRAKVQQPELIDAPQWMDQLLLAADNFLFSRPVPDVPDGESVIAGYPWFGDWGRDTMIALPGLTLATGRYDSAVKILKTFARFVEQGMLPNVFPGAGMTPEYNTVDAALWYVEAWRAYFAATGDRASLAEVFPVLEDMIAWHVRGTRYCIGVDAADGLLYAGERVVQLTWMDAKIGEWVVTPRIGKPVEINALWYNALIAMARFAEALRRPADSYRALAARVQQGFRRFVNADSGGLYDVIDGPAGVDPTLRPNQIFAVSLPGSPLDEDAQRQVVALCGKELLTSYGLRSLAPAHSDFRGRYQGGVRERDGSYHQGPVWAWLLGHYALAEYRVHRDAAAAQARLEPLADHLRDAGLGTVSEIFDGAPPHTPRGAPAQAWSVACTLEAWWRLEKAKRQARASSAKDEPATRVAA